MISNYKPFKLRNSLEMSMWNQIPHISTWSKIKNNIDEPIDNNISIIIEDVLR